MADIKSKEERSRNMSAIRGKNTRPEVYLRKLLFAQGYRYRKNYAGVTGHPDIWLLHYHTAIFVHGCFWHRHEGCRFAYLPKSNVQFWTGKFQHNVERDRNVREILNSQHIKCLVVWECELKRIYHHPEYEKEFMNELDHFVREDSDVLYQEIPSAERKTGT
ncbi:MAG: very short patch repair endonuclease [Eubacteriales bacterium]|jgi:DNA mismatch endonuclease (patch repair protein)